MIRPHTTSSILTKSSAALARPAAGRAARPAARLAAGLFSVILTVFPTVFLTVFPTVFLTGAAPAQDLVTKAPEQSYPIAIIGATIHPIEGLPIRGGTIVFEKGRITGIHQTTPTILPPACIRIQAQGKHIYPGMISAKTTIGLQEIGMVRATRDNDETGDITPEVRAAVAVNPDSTTIPVTRTNGVVTVAVVPSGGLIPGRLSVIDLAGWTWEDMAIKTNAGLVVNWPAMPSGNRSGRRDAKTPEDARKATQARRDSIDEAFRSAIAYHSAKKNRGNENGTDIRWEAMAEALTGTQPTFLQVNRLEAIQSSVLWALSLGLRPVVVGGGDASGCIDLLKRHNVPVIVTGTHRLPKRRDSAVDAPYRLPSLLEKSGVTWCLAGEGGYYNERNLPYHAATAVAHGLSVEAGLRAVTKYPAQILGIGQECGTLEVGKRATLLITDGNPLEYTTKIERIFVSGRDIDMSNKQTALAAKYRTKYRQQKQTRTK